MVPAKNIPGLAFHPRGEVGGAIIVASRHENKVKRRVYGVHGLYAQLIFFSKPSGRQIGSTVVCPVPAIVNDFFLVGCLYHTCHSICLAF